MKRLFLWIVALGCLATIPTYAVEPKLELKDGDRIVLIGDTLIERDQKHGYLETILSLQNPDKNLIFRNLGWSGDTVYGDARAGFGIQADGFRQLKEHVLALKPTVLLVGYGMNESFEGESYLGRFVAGLNGLLDALAASRARVVLLSPITHENVGRPLPDPSRHNRTLSAYARAIEEIAQKRGAAFVSLQLGPETLSAARGMGRPLTDDGIHLTAAGYSVVAEMIGAIFRASTAKHPWKVEIIVDGGRAERVDHANPKVKGLEWSRQRLRFEATSLRLPEPKESLGIPGHDERRSHDGRRVQVKGLSAGRYVLKAEGKPLETATAEEWARGVTLQGTEPEDGQVEALRSTINAKNLLYFHRWRPQNETYLFGFRKHEQGNNAREIPLFDPLVEAKEKEIAKLRVPVAHVYELVRESEVGQ